MHKRTCKGKKKTCKRKIKYYKNRRKTYKGKRSRKGKGRNKKGRRILRGGQGDFDMKGYLDLLQEFNYKLDFDVNFEEYKEQLKKCIFLNKSNDKYIRKTVNNIFFDSNDPYLKIEGDGSQKPTSQKPHPGKEYYFSSLCDSTKEFLKNKFESFFLNITDFDTEQYSRKVKQPIDDIKAQALSLYATEIYNKHPQFKDFTKTFQKLAINLYNKHAYQGIKIEDKPKKSIMLGPIELLYPFTSSNKFAVLSVGTEFTWSENFNFNFIMDILTDIGEFFMIIPSANTLTNPSSILASDCEIDETASERATMKELLLLESLQLNNKININTLDDLLIGIDSIDIDDENVTHKTHIKHEKHAKVSHHFVQGIKFIDDKLPKHYEVDHYIHKYVAVKHNGGMNNPDSNIIIENLIKSYEHHHGEQHVTIKHTCTNRADCQRIIPIEEAILEVKNKEEDILLNPYKFHILHITLADAIKQQMKVPSLEEDNLIKVLDELPGCETHEKHYTGTKKH